MASAGGDAGLDALSALVAKKGKGPEAINVPGTEASADASADAGLAALSGLLGRAKTKEGSAAGAAAPEGAAAAVTSPAEGTVGSKLSATAPVWTPTSGFGSLAADADAADAAVSRAEDKASATEPSVDAAAYKTGAEAKLKGAIAAGSTGAASTKDAGLTALSDLLAKGDKGPKESAPEVSPEEKAGSGFGKGAALAAAGLGAAAAGTAAVVATKGSAPTAAVPTVAAPTVTAPSAAAVVASKTVSAPALAAGVHSKPIVESQKWMFQGLPRTRCSVGGSGFARRDMCNAPIGAVKERSCNRLFRMLWALCCGFS